MSGEITFAAKKAEWIAIKKITVDEKTATPEAIGVLMGIRQAIDRKIFLFAGVDSNAIDAIAEKMAKGKKRGYASAAELLSMPKPNAELRAACARDSALPAAEACLNLALVRATGTQTEIETDDFNSAYPSFKISKPRGNFGKRKR